MSKIRLIPVNEPAFNTITNICKTFNIEPITLMHALLTREDTGAIVRQLTSDKYIEELNKANTPKDQ